MKFLTGKMLIFLKKYYSAVFGPPIGRVFSKICCCWRSFFLIGHNRIFSKKKQKKSLSSFIDFWCENLPILSTQLLHIEQFKTYILASAQTRETLCAKVP